MKLNELTNANMPLRASKIHTEALDGNFRIKKQVTKLNWNEIKNVSSSCLKQGNNNLRELYICCLKLKYSDNTPINNNTALKIKKAIKSNELLLTNAIVFLLQSEIEKQKQEIKNVDIAKSSSEILDNARKILNKLDMLISDYQLQLYTLILQKKTQQEIINKCLELSGYVEDNILKLAKAQVKLTKVLQIFKEKGITNNVKRLGYLLAQINQITREYISSFVSSHFLIFQILGINIDKDISLIKNIQFMPYDIDFPDGKNIKIKDVSKMKEDKFVEIQGFVKSLEQVDDKHGKATKAIIQDISTNDEIAVLMPFVNIRVYGLAVGAYCNLNGYVKHNKENIDEKSYIVIDKLRLSTTLEKAWRIAFLNLSNPFYYSWPKNLNMSWSITLN